MIRSLQQSAHTAGRAIVAWWHARLSESHTCVDCQCRVSPWDDVCPGCGTLNPARVKVRPIVWVALGAAIVLGTMWLLR